MPGELSGSELERMVWLASDAETFVVIEDFMGAVDGMVARVEAERDTVKV